MAVIEIPEEEVVDYLVLLKKVNQRHRYLERYLGKRIPVEHNVKINSLIKQLEENIMLNGENSKIDQICENMELSNNEKVM